MVQFVVHDAGKAASTVLVRNRWQEGREDSYRLIDRSSCELHGFRGMATGIDLLLAVCSRLAEICPVDGKRVGPTPHAQLACFAEGSAGYAAHTDGSSMAELDVDMPLDQKQMISSRMGCLHEHESHVRHVRSHLCAE